MAKTGLYVLQEVQEAGDVSWERNVLYKDGIELNKTSTRPNKLGTYVIDDTVYIDGEPIAKNQNASVVERDKFDIDGTAISSDLSFGEVDFDRPQDTELGEKCINITLENYNILINRGLVEGYTAYNPDAIYNIVPSVKTAAIKYFDKSSEVFNGLQLTDIIYNNVAPLGDSSDLSDNTLSENTFIEPWETPVLSVHDYPFRLQPGANLSFLVMVDTFDCDRLERNIISNTFTIIVKDSYDNEIYRNTVYAGQHLVVCEPFKHVDNSVSINTVGETWFSIECIDNHGHGSAVKYFNLLIIDDTAEQQMYEMTTADLEEGALGGYTLVPNNSNSTIAYLNKKALTYLMKRAALAGYDGVVLLNQGTDEEPTKYYFDYHADIREDSDIQSNPLTPDLGGQQYYVGKVSDRTLTAINSTNFTMLSGETPLDFIIRDGAEICRVTQNHIDDNSALNIPATSLGKIWVKWWSKASESLFGIFDSSKEQHIGWYNSELTAAVERELIDYTEENRTTGFNAFPYLRTYNKNSFQTILPTYLQNREYVYVVENTAIGGDIIEFPDNFTLDLNNCILQASQCTDVHGSTSAVNEKNGSFIDINQNFNTHIINGKIVGLLDNNFDFRKAFLEQGVQSGGYICEQANNISVHSSRYCSYEDVESIGAICYDGIVDYAKETDGKRTMELSNGTRGSFGGVSTRGTLKYGTLGCIDYNGDVSFNTTVIKNLGSSSWEATHNNGNLIALVYEQDYKRCHNVGIKYKDVLKITNEIVLSSYEDCKYHEFFISFYKEEDNSYEFIKTIKSHKYFIIKIPEEATHFRVSGYGMAKLINGTLTAVNTADNRNVACSELSQYSEPVASYGTTFLRCKWTDSRSIAFEPAASKGAVWDSCVFENIAYIPKKEWSITTLLADFEDAGQNCDMVTIKNCIVESGEDKGPDCIARDALWLINCRNFTVMNNTNLSYIELGRVLDGYIVNNTWSLFTVLRGTPFAHRNIIYYHNFVKDTFHKDYYVVSGNNYAKHSLIVDGNRSLTRCDEPLQLIYNLREFVSVSDSRQSNGVVYPILIDSKVGNKYYRNDVL